MPKEVLHIDNTYAQILDEIDKTNKIQNLAFEKRDIP